jgi:hypothetical protein
MATRKRKALAPASTHMLVRKHVYEQLGKARVWKRVRAK